ncbi:MAG: sulfite exporter TauE/SafE family protein [Spirochaetaceae bacterium]|nr:MAG: sulfite exporter TauE/SafE family protein [Spirochaetaceae bacterium]
MVLGLGIAVIIGITLGLIGGGGSILTVPVLVYVMGVPAVEATAYSLFIVGTAALVGAIGYLRSGAVNVRVAMWFAAPSLLAVFATRRWIVPAIPTLIAQIGALTITKDIAVLLLFALTMLFASISMIRGCKRCLTRCAEGVGCPDDELAPLHILIEGIVVGTLTGLVGAGGGFLIIPALVIVAGLPMKQAVGTSLVIIAVKSLFGFVGDLGAGTAIDWRFMLAFAAATVLGMAGGVIGARFIADKRLRLIFGWLVLLMGTAMLVREIHGITGLG